MKRLLLTLLIGTIFSTALFAQRDSVVVRKRSWVHKAFANRWVQSTYIGVPLIAAGLIEKSQNNHFQSVRNDFIPNFKNEADNYIQYLPAAVMLGMKIAGVKGKNSWGKMLTADAFTVGLVLATTRGLKPIVKEKRPDGSNNESFPSGHTATAFMAATMLHKEYGHISPWISFGGYTVATATGVMRMMNNRHWMSDVIAGAGFGIVCTEFGYWLADLCFPRSDKDYNTSNADLTDPDRKPSFVSINAGFYVPLKRYKLSGNDALHAAVGGSMGFEGAYFFDKHWGLGGQVNAANVEYLNDPDMSEETGSVHFVTTQAGGYFSQKLCERLFIKAKVLGGAVIYPNKQDLQIPDARKAGLCGTTGISLGLRAKDHFDVSAGVDYTAMPSYDKSGSVRSMLVVSGSAAIRF